FLLTRSGDASTSLTIDFSLAGTATDGVDYTHASSIVIPAGVIQTSFTITPADDNLVEGNESVVFLLHAGEGYSNGNDYAGMVIADDPEEEEAGPVELKMDLDVNNNKTITD